MPISDAARRLLAARSGRPDLAPSEAEPERSDDPNADENVDKDELERRTGFRERAAREDERFRLATDSEYWFTLCFRKPADPGKFCRTAGLPEGRYQSGPALAAALGDDRPVRTARDRAKALLAARATTGDDTAADQLNNKPLPDPLAGLDVGEDLQADSAAELAALHAAFTRPPDPAPTYLLDSPHWLAVYFPSRDDKDEFLAATGLDVLGDKYLDGHQAARTLKVKM